MKDSIRRKRIQRREEAVLKAFRAGVTPAQMTALAGFRAVDRVYFYQTLAKHYPGWRKEARQPPAT